MTYGPHGGTPSPQLDPRHHAVVTAITPWYKRSIVRILLMIATLGVIGVCAGIMLMLIGVQLGPGLTLVAAGFAAIPVPLLLMAFLWLDRYEPEPWHYLAATFCWGAFVATLAALFINTTSAEAYRLEGGTEPMKVIAVFVAPPAEEISKAIPLFILLGLIFFGRRNIHGVVDGIVYAGFAAVGFAFTENVLYFGRAYVEGSEQGSGAGIGALIATFIMRAVMSPFAHPMFTVMTGIGVGIAARSRKWSTRIIAPLIGLLLAIFLHGLWNFFASRGDLKVLFIGYIAVMIPIFLLLSGIAIWVRRRESNITNTALPAYVAAGWLTAEELHSLSSMRERLIARDWARSYGGSHGAKAMQAFQLAATRLAILRDDAVRGIRRNDYANQERELLNTLTWRRREVLSYVWRWTRPSSATPYSLVPTR
ncbi:MAG: PrsW family intramembrane metalloprotease [Corynebacteriales bacterium]|nr:PrsW family intramembrane metalloprotease [Mycobacteriales bacterium]